MKGACFALRFGPCITVETGIYDAVAMLSAVSTYGVLHNEFKENVCFHQ